MNRIAGILKIRSGEGRMALLLVGLMLATSAGMGLGGSGIDALFFSRFGVQYLPTMYLILGGVTLVTMLVTSALLGSLDQRRLYTTLPVILAVILVAERALMALDIPWVYPVIWLAKGIIGTFQGLFTWGLASAACESRQAKRLFPLFSAGGILGTVIGASLTPLVVGVLHSENLILVWAAALGVAFGIGWLLAGRGARAPHSRRGKMPGLVAQMRQGFDFVRRSELLSLISTCAMLFSVAWFALEFPFNSAATAAFPDADALAGFLGIFMGINTAVALLASLLLANRLFARFGIIPMILIFPAIYLGGFIILTVAAPFPLIAAVRFAQIGWAQGIAGTAWQAMYNVIPSQRRDQARAFIDGVPSQAGIVIAGILLIISQRFLTPQHIYLIGLVTSAIILFVLWRAGRAYRSALVEAVKAGQPQVFVTNDTSMTGFIRDGQVIEVLVKGLSDPDPVTRRLSIDMLAMLPGHNAIDPLTEILVDPDPANRAAAVRALAADGLEESAMRAAICISDPDPDVRAEAAAAMGHLVSPPAHVTSRLHAMLSDPAPVVRAGAALALAMRQPDTHAEQTLTEMSSSPDPDMKIHALRTLGLLGDGRHFDQVSEHFTAPDPVVRRAAIVALAGLDHPRRVDTLVLALGDEDQLTRDVVTRALGQIGAPALDPVIAALYVSRLEDAALTALGLLPIDEATTRKIRAYVLERAADARRYENLLLMVPAPDGDERAGLLAASLLGKARKLAIRALRGLSLISPRRDDMTLAVENLGSPNAAQQAKALEVLDAQGGHAEIIRPLTGLWEPVEAPARAPATYIMHVLQDEDGWLRACGALTAGHTDHWEIKTALEDLAGSDRDPLVRETAIAQLDTPPEGTRRETLPVMERILFLRRVALFGGLAPSELKPIAEIAEELRYKKGSAICKQGELGDRMYVLTSGEVSVMVSRGGAKAAEIARRGPGDVVGEMTIISHEPRIASVIAVGEVRMLAIDRVPFEKLLRERPEIGLGLMRVLCARLREKSV